MKKHELTTTVHMPEVLPDKPLDKAFCDKIMDAVCRAMGVPPHTVERFDPPKNGVFLGVVVTEKGKQ